MSSGERGDVEARALLSRGVLRRQLAILTVPARTEAILAGLPPGPGHLDAACARAGVGLERLVNALARDDSDARVYREGVAALSGLGPGLTPTGDDLLVALLVAGHQFTSTGLMPEGALDPLALAVAASPSRRTTPTAEHWLGEACHGRAPAPLAHFVEALGNPEIGDEDLAERCASLVATGAHSGADWLAGVVALSRHVSGCEEVGPRTPSRGGGQTPDPGPRTPTPSSSGAPP